MIQELWGGNNVGTIKSDQKPKLPTSPPTSSSSAATATAAAAPPENLRCPRCDSSNTKFCYYNNYNLTQPRHFCKTCRRYWTKGGALRNVPIGGGCRKNRSASSAAGKSPSGRPKSAASSDFIKMGLFSGFDHAPPDPTLLWAAPPQTNYNFLSLLRANQNPNTYPTHNTNNNNNIENSISMKEEGYNGNFLFGFDPARLPSSGLPGPFHGHGESQNNGIHELYQRLRAPPASCYYNESSPSVLGNMGSANSPTAANSGILESAPVGTAGELGFWNAGLSWPVDLPTTTNGAYQ